MKTQEKQKILVVDHSPTNVDSLIQILGDDYTISIASKGKDVLNMARRIRPDLVMLDVQMPDMDGYKIFQCLKDDLNTKDILVVFVTSKGAESDEAKGLKMGAIDYIHKPYHPAIVKARIHNHLQRCLAEQTIQRLHQHNQMILSAAGEGVYGIDLEGVITFMNPAAAKMFGWPSEALIGQLAHVVLHHSRSDKTPYPNDHYPTYDAIRDSVVHKKNDAVFWNKEGSSFSVEYISTPIRETDETKELGKVVGAVVVFRDVSHQKKLEAKELNSQISRIAISALLETSLEPLSLKKQLDVALKIILSVSWLSIEFKGSIFLADNKAKTLILAAQLGFTDILLERCDRIPFGYCLCGRAAESGQLVFCNTVDYQHDVVFEGIHQHGHYCVPITSQKQLIGVLNLYVPHNHVQNPEEDAFVVTIANTLAGIIVRRKLEEELEQSHKDLAHMARHDKLTGLPNRMLFGERLHQSLIRARRDRSMMALMFIDLDRFKYVNDTFGHETGDLLLIHVANCIKSTLREADTVARMGGDEFTAIISTITHEEDAILVAKKIVDQLKQPLTINKCTCEIGASIGISIFPLHAENTEALLKRADVAMYCVKEGGRNNYLVYKKGMEKRCPNIDLV